MLFASQGLLRIVWRRWCVQRVSHAIGVPSHHPIRLNVAAGTVVLWRMQPLLGDASGHPTDSHVIMRHIPHMCDVKDIRSVCHYKSQALNTLPR